MTRFYALAARLSGMAAVVCAALAVLAYSGHARANDLNEDCINFCKAKYDPSINYTGYMSCYSTCYSTGFFCGGNSCSLDCVAKDGGGNCGSKLCNNGNGCMYCKCDYVSEFDPSCTCVDQ